jgi:holo-[acyl-carrier protein] synthase
MAAGGALRVGLDLIEVERIRSALGRPRFRERCFTRAERDYCDSRANPAQSYAARFAGKEAVGKALGCGVHFTWVEIEIAGRPRPTVTLAGKTKAWADKMGVDQVDLSMTHSKGMAAAVAILSIKKEDLK